MELEITVKQQEAVRRWVKDNGGKLVQNLNNGVDGSAVFGVKGRQLVTVGSLRTHRGSILRGERLLPKAFILLCDDNQAAELEADGIVNFTDKPNPVA